MRVSPKDPGYESKEDLNSLTKAAVAGGFTKIVTLPNTKPTVQTKESIAYYKGFSKTQVVDILPAAAECGVVPHGSRNGWQTSSLRPNSRAAQDCKH